MSGIMIKGSKKVKQAFPLYLIKKTKKNKSRTHRTGR